MMQSNRVKAMLAQRQATVGSWLGLGCPEVAEIMANVGFDWLVVDTEHGPMDFEKAQAMLQAMNGTQTVPMLRVAWNDPVLIKRALDIGAMGLVIPLVTNREEAELAVRAARYPPQGIRGIGVGRAHGYGLQFKQYIEAANREIMVVVQIEDIEAVRNIEDIVSVEGIDALFIGPLDLSGSMGFVGQFDPLPANVVEAVDQVIKAAKRAGMPLGIWVGSPEAANERIAQGFQFVGLGLDCVILGMACQEMLSRVKRTP